MDKALYRNGIFFLMLFFYIPIHLSSQNLLVESLTGPVTQNEINAFKAYIKSTTRTPLPVDNVGNSLAYGTAGQNTRAMGLMYEITGDTAILNRMILFSDYILACRNDNVNGRHDVVSTGKAEPVWPNYNDNPAPANNQGWLIGAEQGDILEHFVYCAELILKNAALWNRTVSVGDKFGYGATYLQRAKKYIDEANYTIDQVIYPHNVNPTTNLLVWFDKTNILPWNQQMMILGGFFRVARCLEILGTDQIRLSRYNTIISYNCIRFTNHLNQFKYTQNGKDYFVWAYVEQNPLRYIEDNTEHSTYDVYGMHRNYRYGKYGVTRDIMVNFGNTMKDIIMLPDGTYAMNVDGGSNSGDPRGSLRPDWVIASGFRTDLYVPYAKSQMSNGGTRPGSPRSESNILWVKYMNYHKLWDNFEYNALSIPGKIEAEHYNLGGEGISYHDLTAGNTLNAFRMDGVDIQTTVDAGGGYNIGAVQTGEWLEYTVNVTTAGRYQILARVSATAAGKTFHIEMDGQNISGAISVPNTGNYQTFQTVSITTQPLTVGQKKMRVVMDSPSFNLNHITFVLNQAPVVSITAPVSGSTVTSGSAINITASASDSDGSVTKVDFYVDGTKINEDLSSPYNASWTTVLGIHSVKAVAIDNAGASSFYEIDINVVQPNQSPQVSVISPTDNITVTAGEIVPIQISAADTDGSIINVSVYVDNVKAGEMAVSLYSFNWIAAEGSHVIQVTVTDDEGGITNSIPVTITVNPLSTELSYSSDAGSLIVYPNPAASEIIVKIPSEFSGTTSFVLLDALGKEIAILAKGIVNSETLHFNLDALKLKSGVYMIQMINDTKSSLITFIKE